MNDMEKSLARGIAEEKTRESLAVFMVIGAIFIGFLIGSSFSPGWGIAFMLGSLFPIWRYYRR